MSEPKNPFGLHLSQKLLRAPALNHRGVSDRGTANRFGTVLRANDPVAADAKPGFLPAGSVGWYSESLAPPKSIPHLNRELSAARVETIFSQPTPANVSAQDTAASDYLFRDPRLALIVKRVAGEFRVSPGLLAEHLAAEVKNFDKEYSKVPPRFGIWEWVRGKTLATSSAGLDDWVTERSSIQHLVPAAKNIPQGVWSPPIPAESDLRKYQKLLQDVPPSLMKPQALFSLYDGMRASAAYLKYKESLVRNRVGAGVFDSLPQPVKLQLTRLAINPTKVGAGTGEVGLRHWIGTTNRGQLENLFDFRPLSSNQTGDQLVQDVVRRATIHTVRAMHMEDSIFPDRPEIRD